MNKIYLRFSNGSTTMLIDINNEVAQNEAVDSGFYMVYDKDGKPAIVESEELLKGKSITRDAILEAVAERIGKKSSLNYNRING